MTKDVSRAMEVVLHFVPLFEKRARSGWKKIISCYVFE